MKRFLSLLVGVVVTIFSIASCTKQDPTTTYTVKFNISSATASSAIKCDVTVFEYTDAGEKIGQNTIDQATVGTTRQFTANSRAVKVKVYIKMYAPSTTSVSPKYLWVQQVYYLEKGKNIDLPIEDSTMTGSKEP